MKYRRVHTQLVYKNQLGFFIWTLVCFAHWSFSLIRKMEMGETIITRYAGARRLLYKKNYLSVYNKVVQAIL